MSRVPCRFGKHGLEEFFGALQALLGEHDGLGLVDRVVDQALLVEPVERVPIKPLPGPPVVVKGQIEERQHRVVNLVRVERHPRTVPELLELRWRSWPHAYAGADSGGPARGDRAAQRAEGPASSEAKWDGKGQRAEAAQLSQGPPRPGEAARGR